GHTEAVRNLAFSPDGKWLASASDDCTVKGKTITEFKSHSAAVNVVQFHPNEYLLASGSSDRCIKLWDLEKFTMVGSLEGDTSAVRCLLFSPDGSCLYSGASDSLRVFGWEPDRCFDVVPVGWGKVSDLAVCNQQLIGVSHQLSSVSSYVVDLKRVKKSGGAVIQGIIQDNKPLTDPAEPKGAALRRNYERPTTTCSSNRLLSLGSLWVQSAANHRGGALSDDSALSQIKKGHDTMCVMLSSRHRNLQTVRSVWAREDVKSALDAAVSMNDLSITVDVLNIVNLQP
ncbi:hypothetical protein XENOCAPTIV_013565, partial [Xenoophorus captivus]